MAQVQREYATRLFQDDLNLSVEGALKVLDQKFDGRQSLGKEELSRLRVQVQERVERAGGATVLAAGVVRRPKIGVSPKALSAGEEKLSGTRDPTPPPVLVPTPPNESPTEKSDTAQRAAWLTEWAKDHASVSVHEAREAVKKHFGISLGTALINRIMKQARVDAGLPALKRGRRAAYQGTPQVLPADRMDSMVDELRRMGVRRIEISDDDYRAELTITRGKK